MKPEMLKDVRTRLKLGVPEMCALLGVHPRTYYRYEEGVSTVPLCVETHIITLLNNATYLMAVVGKLKGPSP